jgi:hypothetical protein
MKKYAIIGSLFLLILFIIASKEFSEEQPQDKGASPTDSSLATLKSIDRDISNVIIQYFSGFNDVEKYSKVSSSNFIEIVYFRCFGRNGSSLTEMIESLKGLEGELLHIESYRIEYFEQINESEVHLTVTRIWENSDRDQISYIIRKINNLWKFDEIKDELFLNS